MKKEKRDYKLFVSDIFDAIEKIEQFVGDMSYQAMVADDKTTSAVVRKIEIIGEAAKNIPKSLKEKYPALPWSYMTKMRDKIAHFYFGVDYEIVWQVIKQKLPELKIRIKTILDDLKANH